MRRYQVSSSSVAGEVSVLTWPLRLLSLAYAELRIALAVLIRQLKMELFETTDDDVTLAHDLVTASPRRESPGVRVRVRAIERS